MKSKKPEGFKKMVFETFREIGSYEKSTLESPAPTCWNGYVSIEKYRITIEKIEEPVEVLAQRLEDLWENSHNYHDMDPLKAKAAQIGYEIKGKWASKKAKK